MIRVAQAIACNVWLRQMPRCLSRPPTAEDNRKCQHIIRSAFVGRVENTQSSERLVSAAKTQQQNRSIENLFRVSHKNPPPKCHRMQRFTAADAQRTCWKWSSQLPIPFATATSPPTFLPVTATLSPPARPSRATSMHSPSMPHDGTQGHNAPNNQGETPKPASAPLNPVARGACVLTK